MPSRCPYAALHEPEFHADPHAVYERLRARYGPVIPAELEPGVRGWIVIDYATLIAWCRDTDTFSRDSRIWADWNEGRIDDTSSVLPMMMPRPNALFQDGSNHQRYRRAITDSLGRIDNARLLSDIRHYADGLIDEFCAHGEVELLDRYVRLLPLLIINQLFGFDEDSGRRFITALRNMWDGVDAERANHQAELALSAVVGHKRRHPGDDLTSWLMDHRAELSDEEVIFQLFLITAAANEPTANLIGNAMRLVLTDDELAAEIAGSRVSIADAIDRVLWTDSPVSNYPVMYPTRDVELDGGEVVRKGTPVLLGFAAANRFLAQEYSERMADAPNRAHLSWGVGPHRCPGQDPATAIAVIAIRTLLSRLPDLRLAVPAQELEWRVSPFSRALTRLPVQFTPQSPPEEKTVWKPSDSPQETSTPRRSTSEASGRSSLSSFLAKWLPGR